VRRKYARTIIVPLGVGLGVGSTVGVGVGAGVTLGVGVADGVGSRLSFGDGDASDAEAVGITGAWEPVPDGLDVAVGLPHAATRAMTTSVASVR
jgi:hypothetical protein